jgi:hypothetical protein
MERGLPTLIYNCGRKREGRHRELGKVGLFDSENDSENDSDRMNLNTYYSPRQFIPFNNGLSATGLMDIS